MDKTKWMGNLAAAWLSVSLATVATPRLRAQDTPPVLDPTITSVVTGGYWRSDGRDGTLRAIIVTNGFDHLVSRLYVQWLTQATDTGAPHVFKSQLVEAVSAGGWVLSSPRLVRSGSQWQFAIDAANSHFSPPRRGRWILTVGAPGTVTARLTTQ